MGVIKKLNTLRKVNNKLGLLDAGDILHLAMAYGTLKSLHHHKHMMPDMDIKKISFLRNEEEEEKDEFLKKAITVIAIAGGVCLLAHNKGKIKEAGQKAVREGEKLKDDIEDKTKEFMNDIDTDDLINDMYDLKKEIDGREK